MPICYVLINTEPAHMESVLEALNCFPVPSLSVIEASQVAVG